MILRADSRGIDFRAELDVLLLTTNCAYELVAGRSELCSPLYELWRRAPDDRWLDLRFESEDGSGLGARLGDELIEPTNLYLRARGTSALIYSPSGPAYALTPQGWLGQDKGAPASSVTVATRTFFEPRFSTAPRGRLSALAACRS